MPNLASALKEEIRRLARKEIRAETGKTKQAVANYRSEIAPLKRLLQEQQKKVKVLEAHQRQPAAQPEAGEDAFEGIRYSAPFGSGPAEAAWSVGRTVRPSGWRVGSDDLPLGTWQGPASQGPIGRPDRRPGNWETRRVEASGNTGFVTFCRSR